MNRVITTYGELVDMLNKELSGTHFLIQVLPGADFDEAVQAMRNDGLSPEKFHDLVIGGVIQIVHPDEAREYHESSLMQIDGRRQSYLVPVAPQSKCIVEAYEGATFFQVLGGEDN